MDIFLDNDNNIMKEINSHIMLMLENVKYLIIFNLMKKINVQNSLI